MTRTEREIRILVGLQVEERKGAQTPVLAGYAAVFDVETDIAGFFREKIARPPSPSSALPLPAIRRWSPSILRRPQSAWRSPMPPPWR